MAVLDGSTNAEVISAVQTFMNSAMGMAASDVAVTITATPATGNPNPLNVLANCQPRDLITIKVQVAFNKVALIPGKYMGSKQLIGQSSMRHE